MNRTLFDVENEIVYCTRCGIAQTFEQVYKRKIRNSPNPDWCRDCRDDRPEFKPQYKWRHPKLGSIYCWLWLGELDDQWRPIDDDGALFRPGDRICGLKDCVRVSHVTVKKTKRVRTKK
jgi:hypothetical protein